MELDFAAQLSYEVAITLCDAVFGLFQKFRKTAVMHEQLGGADGEAVQFADREDADGESGFPAASLLYDRGAESPGKDDVAGANILGRYPASLG